MRVNRGGLVGGCIAIAGITDRGTHRGSNVLVVVSMLLPCVMM
jgi:hypothetical protein